MDDEKDSQYSRAPKIEDLVSLCKSLNKQKAKYILIGGFAIGLHGYARATKDIDFLVDPSEENIQRIKSAMASLPDNAASEIQNHEVAQYQVVRIADEVVVDLMAKACGIDYKTAESEIEIVEIDGVEIPIATKELLIRTKDTVRPHDKLDVEFLKIKIEAEKNNE